MFEAAEQPYSRALSLVFNNPKKKISAKNPKIMHNLNMSSILCAIRGGPESQITLNHAIKMAIEKDLVLHLLYVVNLDFLSTITGVNSLVAEEELRSMGEFILEIAQEDAEEQGVETQSHIRQGQVTEEIIKLANELNTDYIVLGKRKATEEHPTTEQSVVLDFIEKIEAETTAKIIIAESEAIK